MGAFTLVFHCFSETSTDTNFLPTHRLLFSEVIGEKSSQRKLASTSFQTYNYKVLSQMYTLTTEPLARARNREHVHSVAVYQKYLTRLGELIIFEPWLENYHFSQPS